MNNSKDNSRYDLIVIGGGAGGLVSAGFAATLGLRVALVSESPLGGECLYTGCVPSKALIHAAKNFHIIRQSGHSVSPDEAFAQAMAHVKRSIKTIEPHDSPERMQQEYGIETIIRGKAHFVDPHTIEVNHQHYQARKFVLATGASVFIPPIPGLNEVNYWTHETVFEQKVRPKTMAVIGGGPIGVEMAQAFQRLGTQVYVIQCGPRLLPKDEPEASACIQECLRDEGITWWLETETTRISQKDQVITLELKPARQEAVSLTVDALLVATGKQPVVSGLNLEAAGVHYDTKKGIWVDEYCRTTARHIFAVGDVTQRYQFTHYAEHQAKVAITNAFLKWPMKIGNQVVPWITYTNPEAAHVGMLYEEAKKQFAQVHRLKLSLDEVDRFSIENETTGFAEVLVNDAGKILGATLVSAHAGEIIHEIALAMQQKINIQDVGNLIHAYPTRSDVWKHLATEFSKKKYLTGWKAKAISWWSNLKF